ncbi:MAG TPA: aldose 1-epimerase [Bryobacteraceae bacterium]|nr:aldose 1-epimerase [Bryobacteraceae bacterium]
MASNENYSAQKLVVDGVETVRLSDAARRVEVSIAPSIGNIAYDFRVNGQPILMPPSAPLAEWKAKPSQAGIPFLAPWANRLDSDSYWINGRRYHLNPDVLNIRRDGNGLPIHGLVLFADWQIARLRADGRDATLTSRLDFWKHPEWMAQFPFAHSIEMTYRLAAGVLEVATRIENHSAEELPLVIGYHPWFQIPDIPRNEWQLHLPVREHYSLTEKFVPTGEKKPANVADPLPLAGRRLDDVFGGVHPDDEFRLEARGRKIAVRYGPKFPIAVVYAPDTQNVACFEPMTAVTNGFNLSHAGSYPALPAIPPGGSWAESFWIRTEGF